MFSPVLYALFINGLVKKLQESKLGIVLSELVTLESLLYADDIVLITDDKFKLQQMLDIVAEYAKKWRFELNPKKSEIVVFGSKYPPKNLTLQLGEHTLETVSCYKYLGIELTRTLKWTPYTERILEKATRNMQKTWAMGIPGGFLGIKVSVMKRRSILEYGCEIWGLAPSQILRDCKYRWDENS